MRLALEQGYQVEVVCFEFNNWSYAFNQQIKKEFSDAKLHIIQAGRKPFFSWAISVFLEKFFRIAGKVIPLKGWVLSQAVSRRALLLMQKIKIIDGSFDLVIGHNPGALYPTYFAGKRFKAKTGFDVEDYHPGETNDRTASERAKQLMLLLLPKMNFLTFGSRPIRTEIRKIVNVDGPVILNWFSSNEFRPPLVQSGKLKLVWFSQNISFNRGLEIILPVIEQLEDGELHLFGNCNPEFKNRFLSGLKNTFLHAALPQKVLHETLCEFDCGLAIEPKKDLNNDLAVSNKMLAYFQAGLYIIASDTKGQKDFLESHPQHGTIVDLHSDSLKNDIEKVLLSKKEIRSKAFDRYASAEQYSWEKESEKLLRIWSLSC